MEEKKHINITEHAIMRYAARVYNERLIEKRFFNVWSIKNEKKIEEIEELIKMEFAEAEYITIGTYEKYKKAEFYINEEKMMTYVVVENDMVTCYKIDFGLDEVENKEIYLGFKNTLKKALEEEEQLLATYREIKVKIYSIREKLIRSKTAI